MDDANTGPNEQVKHVVVLIHGTWARGIAPIFRRKVAPWCDDRSPLRQAVASGLGDGVVFNIFRWSGANSPRARLNESYALQRRVVRLSNENRDARIHVVAHSHAGNIVLYAMHGRAMRRVVSSIACLSTPFLHVTVRPRVQMRSPVLEILICGGVTALAATAASLLHADLVMEKLPGPIETILDCGLAVLTYLCVRALWRQAIRRAQEYSERLRLPRHVGCPMFILRNTADEALSGLGLFHLVSALFTRLLDALVRFMPVKAYHYVNKNLHHRSVFRRFIDGGSLTANAGAALMPLSLCVALSDGMGAFAVPVSVLDILCSALLAVSALFALLSLALALSLVPFGARFVIASPGLQIAAEPTPPGSWCVRQMGRNRARHARRLLRHATHSDPMALHLLRRWFREQRR